MSRYTVHLTKQIAFTYGNDHAAGKFIDICDSRFANNPTDTQGDGYVFEWSQMFGITVNHIGLELHEAKIMNHQIIILKCDNFINQLNSLTYN